VVLYILLTTEAKIIALMVVKTLFNAQMAVRRKRFFFCSVIAVVPVTQHYLIGWFHVVAASVASRSSRARIHPIHLPDRFYFGEHNKKVTAAALGVSPSLPEQAASKWPQQQWICFSFLTQLTLFITKARAAAPAVQKKYPALLCAESSPELK